MVVKRSDDASSMRNELVNDSKPETSSPRRRACVAPRARSVPAPLAAHRCAARSVVVRRPVAVVAATLAARRPCYSTPHTHDLSVARNRYLSVCFCFGRNSRSRRVATFHVQFEQIGLIAKKASRDGDGAREVVVVKPSTLGLGRGARFHRDAEDADVIDLGAPLRRARAAPTPRPTPARRARPVNPRLYPGPQKPKHKPERRRGQQSAAQKPKAKNVRRGRRRRAVSTRLYRPPPPPRPPPRAPEAWPPPAPARGLESASRAALRLHERRQQPRLELTLPSPPPAPLPARAMDELEDGSDGNDPASAPSEFLAEFLSAIMQRQYAEALKYCRLILQYEPHNVTARGFYPLLQHKAGGGERMQQGGDSASSRSPSRGSDSSCGSQSSLEPDSSPSSGSGGWESAGTGSNDNDANGNEPDGLHADDLENDNLENDTTVSKVAAPASLRRLRAIFACSTK